MATDWQLKSLNTSG